MVQWNLRIMQFSGITNTCIMWVKLKFTWYWDFSLLKKKTYYKCIFILHFTGSANTHSYNVLKFYAPFLDNFVCWDWQWHFYSTEFLILARCNKWKCPLSVWCSNHVIVYFFKQSISFCNNYFIWIITIILWSHSLSSHSSHNPKFLLTQVLL
jgi:hypothetical protein